MGKGIEAFDIYSLKKRILDSKELKYTFISILLFTIFLIIISPPWKILNFDEIDYFNASRKGLWDNAFDSSSLGIKSFLSLSLWKLNIISETPKFFEYKESIDIFLLRHFHPPFLQYISSYFAFIPKENFKIAENFVFLLRWGLGCVFIISSYSISALLFRFRKKKKYYLVKILFISYSALLLSLYLQYHLLIAILLQVTCYSFLRLLNNQTKSNFLLFSLTLAFSIISLETTLFSILIFSTIYFFINIKESSSIIKLIRKIFTYFWFLPFIFSIILWPGALLKLSIFKSYGMYVYKLFFIKTEWSGVFDFERITPILIVLLVYIALLALSVIFIINYNSLNLSEKNPYKIFFIFGTSYTFCMLAFSLFHTYTLPGLFIATLPVLEIFNFEIIQNRLYKFSNFLIVVFISIGILQLNMGFYENFYAGFPGKKSLKNITEISTKKDLSIYSDAGNILEFYLPKLSSRIKDIKLIKKDSNQLDSKFKLFLRENQNYKLITSDSIKKPALFLFRDYHLDITNKLDYPCNLIEIKGLEGQACIVAKNE